MVLRLVGTGNSVGDLLEEGMVGRQVEGTAIHSSALAVGLRRERVALAYRDRPVLERGQ